MNQTKEQSGTLIVGDPGTMLSRRYMGDTQSVEDVDTGINLGKRYTVILYNDSFHDMEEVSTQIIKAIHCTQTESYSIMMEAHTKGRAAVYLGGLERAEHVSAVLEEIRLGTKVEEV